MNSKIWDIIKIDEYKDIINKIKNIVKNEGLDGIWSIEKYWVGHRERIK